MSSLISVSEFRASRYEVAFVVSKIWRMTVLSAIARLCCPLKPGNSSSSHSISLCDSSPAATKNEGHKKCGSGFLTPSLWYLLTLIAHQQYTVQVTAMLSCPHVTAWPTLNDIRAKLAITGQVRAFEKSQRHFSALLVNPSVSEGWDFY